MIVGLGSDLCRVDRIAGALERQGARFRDRICSSREQTLAAQAPRPVVFYAACFAAKEACAKALGTGITDRVRWTHIELLREPNALPALHLSEGALRRAKRVAGRAWRLNLSITSNGAFATALVILEA